jgi:hypothetical protein
MYLTISFMTRFLLLAVLGLMTLSSFSQTLAMGGPTTYLEPDAVLLDSGAALLLTGGIA